MDGQTDEQTDMDGWMPQFYYNIKVGFKGYTLHGHVFLMSSSLTWKCLEYSPI